MKRAFWFGLGVAAGVAATRRAAVAVRKVTPAGAAENIGDAVRELAAAVGSFGADVRAGMVEREDELHRTVAERTGIDTTPRHLLGSAGAAWTLPEQAGSDARARRAGGSPARP